MAIGTRVQQIVASVCLKPCNLTANDVIKRSVHTLDLQPTARLLFKSLCEDALYTYGTSRCFHSSLRCEALPRLSPQEVTAILRENEHTQEFSDCGSVKSYDSNQLSSNNPIEDTRSEAKCLLTTGMLLGVFDGHGGEACAHVIAKRLFHYISASMLPPDLLHKYLESLDSNGVMDLLEAYNNKIELVDELKEIYDGSFRLFLKELCETKNQAKDFLMSEILENAFLRLDKDMSQEALQGIDGKINSKTLSVAMSGAVACVAHIDGPHLHVATAGDCQCVLGIFSDGNSWTAKKLSIEHTADNRYEVERILKDHPRNEKDTVIKMDRLLGQLAPLRALGDFRYKWSKDILNRIVLPYYGESAMPPNYYTPPYLTARPDVIHHRLTPRDKFLVIASDGLWDLISPLQVVRLVGEHMSGKVTLSPFHLPRKNMRLLDINNMLLQRKEGLKMKPTDTNAATHLLRNALGGTEYGIDHGKLSQLLSMPDEIVRLFRDDITITVIYFDSEYLRHCPA